MNKKMLFIICLLLSMFMLPVGWSGTSAIFFHRGQSVTTATTTVVTLTEAVGSRSWANNDRVVVYDGTGYKVESQINDAGIESTDTTITVDSQAALANVGVGATLNGTTQYFNGGDVLDAGTNDISISAWVKVNATPSDWKIITSKGSSSSNQLGTNYGLYLSLANKFGVFVSDGSTKTNAEADNVLELNKWYHIAGVRDYSTGVLTFHVNGVAQSAPGSGATQDPSNASPFLIGARDYSNGLFFNGSIRDARIYIAAGANWSAANILTQATNPHNNAVGGTNTSSWYFTDAAAATTIDDAQAAANDLTLVGGTTTNYGTHSRTQTAFISASILGDGSMEN